MLYQWCTFCCTTLWTKKNHRPKWIHNKFWSLQDNIANHCVRFFKLILNFLWKFHVNYNWIQNLPTFWKIEGLETHVGVFRNDNHFVMFNFQLMNNKSITYIESWVNVAKLDVQCDHWFFLPLFLIPFATVGRLNYWWFFLSPSHAYDIIGENLLMSSYHFTFCGLSFPSWRKLHYQLDWGYKN